MSRERPGIVGRQLGSPLLVRSPERPRVEIRWVTPYWPARSVGAGKVCAIFDAITDRARAAGVAICDLGEAGGDRLMAVGALDIPLADAITPWPGRLPDALAGGTTRE